MKKTMTKKTGNLVETTFWTTEGIGRMCVQNNFYTKGSINEYQAMFDMIRRLKPSVQNIYAVALDIAKHSKLDADYTFNENVAHIMYCIKNDVCVTTYEVLEDCED